MQKSGTAKKSICRAAFAAGMQDDNSGGGVPG